MELPSAPTTGFMWRIPSTTGYKCFNISGHHEPQNLHAENAAQGHRNRTALMPSSPCAGGFRSGIETRPLRSRSRSHQGGHGFAGLHLLPHAASLNRGCAAVESQNVQRDQLYSFSSPTFLASVGQPRQPDGSSRLCLSCHDGTVALGMVNSQAAPIQMANGVSTLRAAGSSASLGTDLSGRPSDFLCL